MDTVSPLNTGMDVKQPTASSTVGQAGATSQPRDQFDVDYLDDSGNLIEVSPSSSASTADAALEESQSSPDPVAQEAAQEPVKEAVKAEPPVAADKQKSGTQRRIDRLTAKMKEKEEMLAKRDFEFEKLKRERDQYLQELADKNSRLGQYEPNRDPVAIENEALRRQITQRQQQQEFEQEWQKRAAEVERKTRVDLKAEQHLEAATEAMEKYPIGLDPDVHQQMLAVAMVKEVQAGRKTTFEQVAKNLYERASSHFEPVVVNKYRGRITAPAPVAPNPSVPLKSGRQSQEDLIAELDVVLGKDWGSKY